MKKVIAVQHNLGCDPEFFFKKKNKIIGAEKLIPEQGLGSGGSGKIIIDGVQAELNPAPNTCRESLSYNIARCFVTLSAQIAKDPSIEVDFSQTVKITDKELKSLDEKFQKFGCAPSKNTDSQAPDKEGKIKVNPLVYKSRSAGGHIHLGKFNETYGNLDCEGVNRALATPDILVPLLDAIVGNTCVLIDRDKGNIERRKIYGKAGEYRTPPHGLEYRTLSNFWLRSVPLMSLAFGLARTAVMVLATSEEHAKYILKQVKREDIVNAINNNDLELALKNWKKISKALLPMLGERSFFPITSGNMTKFNYFLEKGMDYWFPESPLKHWVDHAQHSAQYHFRDFLTHVVKAEMVTKVKKTAKKAK